MHNFKKRFNGITQILFREQKQIISAAGTLIILSLLSKFSGMLCTALLAQKFGASRTTDIFNAANTLPELVTAVLLTSSISGALIPILMKAKEFETKENFLRIFNTLLNVSLLFFLLVAIVLIVFSNNIIELANQYKIINPVEPFSRAELTQIGDLMRYLMVPQVILGIGAFVSSVLNVYERFIIPSLAPIFYNLGKIFGIFILVDMLGGSITGVVWGMYVGSILHLLVQIPLLLHLDISYKFVCYIKNKYFKEAINLSLPRIFSLASEQIYMTVNSIIALSLISGSLSAYEYALSLIAIPSSLFGASFAVAAFPSLSKYFGKNDIQSFSAIFHRVINQIFFFSVPAAVIILILRVPLTRLFFGILGGEFSWSDTLLVSWIVFFSSLGLSFESLRAFMYRVFYSIHNSFLPFVTSVIVIVIGIVLSMLFTNYFSHFNDYKVKEMLGGAKILDINFDEEKGFPYLKDVKVDFDISILPEFSIDKFFTRGEGVNAIGGIALSASTVFVIEFVILMMMLRARHVVFNLREILHAFGKKLLAGASMLTVAYILLKFWEKILNTTKTVNLMLLTFATVIAAFIFYLWVSYILKVPEVSIILDYAIGIWKKIERKYTWLYKVRKLFS